MSCAASTVLKTPKGTSDFGPADCAIRDRLFATITRVFRLHGAVSIDTPVFEAREILTGQYGEDSTKLIYDLADQGGEPCSLRYDLTVPFARYVAMNKIVSIKRYHVAKVYRRDQPVMSKGRRREFYQCDFDIAGTYESMVPDAEVLHVLVSVLDAVNVGDFKIKLNHRALLDAVLAASGVPAALFRGVSSAIDKLDKVAMSAVCAEIIEKGVTPLAAEKIKTFITMRGGRELISQLRSMPDLIATGSATIGALDELETLFGHLETFGVLSKVVLDLSLARGLDYYTGVIFEAILVDEPTTAQIMHECSIKMAATMNIGEKRTKDKAKKKQKKSCVSINTGDPDSNDGDDDDEDTTAAESVGVGSIAAGGRYDNLVGTFSGVSKKGTTQKVPCVGVSIGVERIFAILSHRLAAAGTVPRGVPTDVYVIAVGDGLLSERMLVCRELWEAGISAEFTYMKKPKLQSQFNVCERDAIPLAVILGSNELADGTVLIKDMRQKTEGEDSSGRKVIRSEMINVIRSRLAKLN